MTGLQFLVEWALRSSILILSGALLVWALRVKDPSIRLAAWTAMLCGSLAIPALTLALPRVPLAVARVSPEWSKASMPVGFGGTPPPAVSQPFDWARAAVMLYAAVALALLLRLSLGLVMSRRLLGGSRATGRAAEGIEVLESDRVAAPVTLGITRPVIVLPTDWSQWDGAKLGAVLAHESSHIRRRDPAVQLLSSIHRALLWHSPLSWFLHRRIVRVAEEASDDAAVAATGDRAQYAEVLLAFMRRGVRGPGWQGLPMARYGRLDERIHRILNGTGLSRGVTRSSLAVILALVSPLTYVAATAHPQSAPQVQPAPPKPPAPQPAVQPPPKSAPAPRPQPQPAPAYLNGLGNVAAVTVTIKPRAEGELLSVNFKEGDLVQAGQLLATIDPRPYEVQLAQAEAQLDQDRGTPPAATTDQARVDAAKALLATTYIVSPITGMTGLRQIDPGNIVHGGDVIVTITQLQPISVVFDILEDNLPQVLARLRDGANLPVEVWNRTNSAKLATGRLTAVDNQIDTKTGTVKAKATLDNQNGALFPNQFVNVRIIMNAR